MQKRNRAYQREVFHVITPCSGLIIKEGQLIGIGIDD